MPPRLVYDFGLSLGDLQRNLGELDVLTRLGYLHFDGLEVSWDARVRHLISRAEEKNAVEAIARLQ